jgi:sulfur carrier protein
MQIWVNGEAREIEEGRTLQDLVRELGLEPQGVAVEVNREVVPRGSHADYRIQEADRIEVVRAIGGG